MTGATVDQPDWKPALDTAAAAALSHLQGLPDAPVGAPAGPADILRRVDGPVPQQGTPDDVVVEQLCAAVEGGITRMNSGRFFGWVIGGSTPAGIAADWLLSAWEQNTAIVEATPATVVLEQVAGEWCRELLGLPEGAGVGFVTGGQMANWVGLAAGRSAVLASAGWNVEADGLQGAPPVRAVVGEDAHGTVLRSLRFLGLGDQAAMQVGVDGQGRMRPDALDDALGRLDGGVLVALQAGHISSGAFDPFEELMDVVDRHRAANPGRIWVHVDGALGLWAAASPTHRHLLAGHDRCDSWGTDAHKWLNVPYDCGIAVVRDATAQRRTLGVRASYLPAGDPRFVHPLDVTPEHSRRARGVPVYATIRSLGAEGIAAMVDRCCSHARRFAELLDAVDGVEVLHDVVLNQVTAAFRDPRGQDDAAHVQEMARLVWEDGTCVATPTTWRDRPAMRMSVSNWTTDDADVEASVDALLRAHASAGAGG
jgi:glutamate/tyrosine decarboxylase-like PLP-dependent enzyme